MESATGYCHLKKYFICLWGAFLVSIWRDTGHIVQVASGYPTWNVLYINVNYDTNIAVYP